MKIRSVIAFVVLAISFALPIYAQEQSAVDPKTRQEIEAVLMQFGEVYNRHDAAAIAALYTQDAVRVVDWEAGTNFFGREAIEKGFAADFGAMLYGTWSASSPPNPVRKLVQMCACEDRIVTISKWSGGSSHGHSVEIYVRDADTWKIRMDFVTVTLMPQ